MANSKFNNKNQLFGGIKVANINEIDPKFICPSCQLILFHPCQLLCCGTLFCKWCLMNGLTNSEPFTCPLCHTKQSKKEALPDRGAERELKTVITVCYACNWKGFYHNYLEHLRERHADFECLDCHERFFAINSFQEHRQELCIHRLIQCGLANCADSIKWSDMQAHYLSHNHQLNLHNIVSEHAHPQCRQVQIDNHLKEYEDLDESIDITFSTHEKLLNDSKHSQIEITEIKANLQQNILKFEELKKQDQDNEKNVQVLIEKLNAIQIELDHMKKTHQENIILILDNNSTTILRFTLPNTSPFSMNSLKFRTSSHGYTFKARACSTIESKEAYLSLFLSLYNSEYSNLLPYPFSYDIYLALWDQSNQQKHIICVLRPDLHSSVLVRPINEKNGEYGITKFCLLRYLTDLESIYVKDGVFFIRVFVDFLKTGENPFQMKDNNQNMEIISTTQMITD